LPVTTYAAGALFVLRVTKHLITNPDNKWANSYEFKAVEGGSESELLTLGLSLVNFEKHFHFTTTIFDRLLISTWEPDSVPYDPESFISTTLTAEGELTFSGDTLALDQALSITRSAAFGRFGHLFYRNCLEESHVEAPAGKSILVSRALHQTHIDEALDTSNLGDYIGLAPEESLQLVMVNADGDQVRPVVQLRAQGVSSIKPDHKWFNRRTITVP